MSRALPLWDQQGALVALKRAILGSINAILADIRAAYAADDAAGLQAVQPADVERVLVSMQERDAEVSVYPHITISPTVSSQFGAITANGQSVQWVFAVTVYHRLKRQDQTDHHTSAELGTLELGALCRAVRQSLRAPSTGLTCQHPQYGVRLANVRQMDPVVRYVDDGDDAALEASCALLISLDQITH